MEIDNDHPSGRTNLRATVPLYVTTDTSVNTSVLFERMPSIASAKHRAEVLDFLGGAQ